jgi:hypothetical protein
MYEVGVIRCHPLVMMWKSCVTILRTWRYARRHGMPCRNWYGVYEKGSEVVLVSCGPLPGAHMRASRIVDILSAPDGLAGSKGRLKLEKLKP